MKRILWRVYHLFCDRFLSLMDMIVDLRVCGRSLVKYVPSIDRDNQKKLGGTGSQSTHYCLLRRIFSHVTLTEEDAVLDVGCGKGRVLAFLLREKCPCRLYGVEHNPKVARIAADWSQRYDRVTVFTGDAFSLDYNPYTVLTLARSFLSETFIAFVEQLEQTMTHPVRLVSWYDQQEARRLKGRPGWTLAYREVVDRIHGIPVSYYPQAFSVWTFDPAKRQEQAETTE